MGYTTSDYRAIETQKETFKAMGKNDILYGILVAHAKTTGSKGKGDRSEVRRVSKKEWTKRGVDGIRTKVCKLFGCETRKVNRALEKLIKSGLIEEEKDAYVITESAYDDRKYIKIDLELLNYLCNVFRSPALKIYCYLRWKDYCASTHNDNKNRIFSISKILVDMGYAESTAYHDGRVRKPYIQCLDALQRCGIIKYHTFKDEISTTGGKIIADKHYLDFITKEIPKDTKEAIDELEKSVSTIADEAISQTANIEEPKEDLELAEFGFEEPEHGTIQNGKRYDSFLGTWVPTTPSSSFFF